MTPQRTLLYHNPSLPAVLLVDVELVGWLRGFEEEGAEELPVPGKASSGSSTNSASGFSSRMRENSFIGPCGAG